MSPERFGEKSTVLAEGLSMTSVVLPFDDSKEPLKLLHARLEPSVVVSHPSPKVLQLLAGRTARGIPFACAMDRDVSRESIDRVLDLLQSERLNRHKTVAERGKLVDRPVESFGG